MVGLVANAVARIKGISLGEVAEQTTQNAARLFGLDVRLFPAPRAWR
jgi:Tat protein secretion system quality control protein TatD with DNase activity